MRNAKTSSLSKNKFLRFHWLGGKQPIYCLSSIFVYISDRLNRLQIKPRLPLGQTAFLLAKPVRNRAASIGRTLSANGKKLIVLRFKLRLLTLEFAGIGVCSGY